MTMPETLRAETPPLPTERECPFDPPQEYDLLREQAPIVWARWPNGVQGWLVSRYDDVRALLGDRRLSIDKTTGGMPPSISTGRKPAVMLPKSLVNTDPPEHTPRRKLVVREMTMRRLAPLKPRIQLIVDEHLDAMERTGPPADLIQAFSLPVPSLVISELLGVPEEDRSSFERQTNVISNTRAPAEEVAAASQALVEYMGRLVVAKRRDPGSDILSRLTQAELDGRPLTDEELVGNGMLLLIAGHETTANMIGLSVATLLAQPEQLAALRAHPERIDTVVEELLRYHAIIQFGLVRRAKADIAIRDTVIREGDWVVCSLASANRDPACAGDGADVLDLGRTKPEHVSFGYGIHQCAGQHLARLELRAALSTLFRRFPDLRLVSPVEELPFRSDMFVYGLHELLVTW